MCGFLKILPADDDDDKDPVDPVKPCINVAGTLSVTDFRNGATVDVDVTNTTTLEFQCGKVVRHTAFIGEGGETVRIELTGDGTGFAEIVPHAEG